MKQVKILSASAGSGKTHQLTLKYICEVLEHPECYRNILAVTFTNKATEEMKSRIIKEIHNLASNQPSAYLKDIIENTRFNDEDSIRKQATIARTKILHDYSRFTVLTIDRFFQRILRAFLNELNLDLSYNIELDASLLLERSVDSLVESISEDENSDIKMWLMAYAEDRLKQGDKWDMRKDLKSLGVELFKDGVASRVKSSIEKEQLHKIITDLIKEDDKVINRIKTLSKEAIGVLNDYHLTPSDFRNKNPKFITCFSRFIKGDFDDITSSSVINAIENEEKWYTKDAGENVKEAARIIRSKLIEISTLYNNNISKLNTTKLLRDNYRSYALLSDLYKSFEGLCRQENVMVLDETREILAEFIDQSNAPFIYEKVGNRYNHYMIDEFQDTSARDWNNLLPLLKEALDSNANSSVFIVGDIKQSIYRWRGGDWRLLNSQIEEDLKNYVIEKDVLPYNRRSLKNIVEFNNKFIKNIVEADNYLLKTKLMEGLTPGEEIDDELKQYTDVLSCAYENGEQKPIKESKENGIAQVCFYDPKLEDETPYFIKTIEDALARGYTYKDILILVRNTSSGRKAAEALYAYKNKHAADSDKREFNILTSDALTIDSCDAVRFIIALFRLSINPYDDIERGIYNGFLNQPYGKKFDEEDRELLRHIAHLSPLKAFELIIERFNLGNEHNYIAYIQAMHEQIFSFTNKHIADIQHYLAWWDERGSRESLSVEQTDNTIEIMTIHKAKGLGRAIVILPYCEWEMGPRAALRPIVWAKADSNQNNMAADIGDFPVVYGKEMENSAFRNEYLKELVMNHVDAINLLYVAITRAKKELYMFIPKSLNSKQSSSDSSSDTPELSSRTTPLIELSVKMICEGVTEKDESQNIKSITYTYGERLKHYNSEDDEESSSILLQQYPTYSPKLAIHYPDKRLLEEGCRPGTESSRNGTKLHKAFESAITEADLYLAIDNMLTNCEISSKEAEYLRNKIAFTMKDDTAKEWFSGEWDEVKSEMEILHNNQTYRPDRVMIKEDCVTIVDYKFGFKVNKEYNRKVEKYISLLNMMGCYTSIKGYVWYVKLGIIESV